MVYVCFMVAITSLPTLKWCSVVMEIIQILGGNWVYCARKSTPFKSTDQEAALQLVQARCFAYAKFLGNHPGLTPLKTEGKNHESDFELRKPPSGEWRQKKKIGNWHAHHLCRAPFATHTTSSGRLSPRTPPLAGAFRHAHHL
uniref:Uncharacterized protein n=1 Tax=Oreochromis niloticus TaxID=8128 RepID=A0A669EGR3_ORENI